MESHRPGRDFKLKAHRISLSRMRIRVVAFWPAWHQGRLLVAMLNNVHCSSPSKLSHLLTWECGILPDPLRRDATVVHNSVAYTKWRRALCVGFGAALQNDRTPKGNVDT